MSFKNYSTGEEFEGEDEYLRSMKQDESYEFSYDYEYVADRFGDGDDDVKLENARLNVLLFLGRLIGSGVRRLVHGRFADPNPERLDGRRLPDLQRPVG